MGRESTRTRQYGPGPHQDQHFPAGRSVMETAGCLRGNRKCVHVRAGTWQVIVKSPGDVPLGVNTISQPTVLQSAHPIVVAICAGIPADHPVLMSFLIRRDDCASRDHSHRDKTGHEQRDRTLCIVQGTADPHEPESQVGTEVTMHVIKQSEIFFIKY